MLRILRKMAFRFGEASEKEGVEPVRKLKEEEYLVFPTKFPIFPYYVYTTKLNKHYYDYINKNKIKYCATFPIQPGVSKRTFLPYSRRHLEAECKHGFISVGLNPTIEKSNKTEDVVDTIEIDSNNLIFDGSTTDYENIPVSYVDRV